ncbi:MAG: 6,7-dimethyl-8-ribityllumazine synthase [Chitinophagales bacterium]|nr:6,7-dimethyl-8-ribityllumazine synthase [Chitinophagales bacterium]
MSSVIKNLSDYRLTEKPELSTAKIGVIVSSWNTEITEALYRECRKTLVDLSVKKKNLLRLDVPGSFELAAAAKWLIESKRMEAIICLGCVIQGETRHFEFICDAVANGIMELNIRYSTPVIFGVLTTNDLQQALDRAGGRHGNKGTEAAVTAVQMILLKRKLLK